MKSAFLFTVVAVCCGLPAAAAEPSAAAASKKLEAARAQLATAVKVIEKDPPNKADLDAAHAAVEALKDTIDAGEAQEANSLDYARAALAARKELRTQREYVDQRRANVHIHDARRAIDAALAKLNEAAGKVSAKEPSAKDFDDARASVNAVKKLVDDARQFTKADAKFASFISETDATVAKRADVIDERWVELSVDKHRVSFEASRKGLAAALAPLSKGSTDAQFDTAEKAAAELTKRLEEGKPLEAKDKSYRADADKARGELASARKRMDELWSEAGTERLKAEIEPANKELVTAAKTLRARKPSEDDVAMARTASIVARKLVEKFAPQAARSKAFGDYVDSVEKNLVEVEVALQRRSLDAARADLTQSIRNIERRDPTDEQFQEATTAMTIVEKTLETVHAKEPALSAHVHDAKKQLKEARATWDKRRLEVDVQRQRAKVDEARRNATASVRELQSAQFTPEQIVEAEKAVSIVKMTLDEGAALTKKYGDYAKYDKESRERITELNERIVARKLALAASDGKTALADALSDAKTKLDNAKRPGATDADVDVASKSVDAVGNVIESRTALEKQDKGYADRAERARNELLRLQEDLVFASQARALRKQTAEALAQGLVALGEAGSSRDLRTQRKGFEKAIAQFKACESEGETMVKENSALAKVVVLVDGSPSSPKDVIALCEDRAKDTDQRLKQVVPLIEFDEGPRRSFESAKTLLAQSKKDEAASQFDRCISSGLILQNRNPELKEKKFDVAGANMTLAELTQQCIAQRKTLRAQ